MKRLALLFIFCTTALLAQDSKTEIVGKFSEIKVFDGISANLIKSDENKVVISGEDISDVAVVNKNGKLKIRMEIDKIFSGHRTFVEVYFTEPIDVIDVNENAYIASDHVFDQTSIAIKAQEGGEADLKVAVEKVNVKAVTGGMIELSGDAVNQDIFINTGGQCEADELETEQTTVSVSAGGKAYVNATELVEAKVKAGGIVRIYGDPKVIDKKTFLGGKIIKM